MAIISVVVLYKCNLCGIEFNASGIFEHLLTAHRCPVEVAYDLLEQSRIEGGLEICL